MPATLSADCNKEENALRIEEGSSSHRQRKDPANKHPASGENRLSRYAEAGGPVCTMNFTLGEREREKAYQEFEGESCRRSFARHLGDQVDDPSFLLGS